MYLSKHSTYWTPESEALEGRSNGPRRTARVGEALHRNRHTCGRARPPLRERLVRLTARIALAAPMQIASRAHLAALGLFPLVELVHGGSWLVVRHPNVRRGSILFFKHLSVSDSGHPLPNIASHSEDRQCVPPGRSWHTDRLGWGQIANRHRGQKRRKQV